MNCKGLRISWASPAVTARSASRSPGLAGRGVVGRTSVIGVDRSTASAADDCQDEAVATRLFELLGPDASRALRQRGQRRQFRRREVLFREGDIGDSVYLIERGHVVVKGDRTPGETLTLAVLGPGDYFGDVAVLSTDGRRSAGIETLDECVTFVRERCRLPRASRPLSRDPPRHDRIAGPDVSSAGRAAARRSPRRRAWSALASALRLHQLFDGPVPFTQEDLAELRRGESRHRESDSRRRSPTTASSRSVAARSMSSTRTACDRRL